MEKIRIAARRILRLFSVRDAVPLLLFILFLMVTYSLWRDSTRVADQTLRADFEFRVKELSALIIQRMQAYEQVLRGAAALFAASHSVTRDEFHAYVKALKLQQNYPGVQGVGFSIRISASQKQRHIREIRQSGFPEYDITPHGERPVYTSIIYIEPFSGRNLQAFGYDMYSEPRRHEAMVQAMDAGMASVSRKTTLVQEVDNNIQPGFLMYLPVYMPHEPHDMVSERRANLVGWVYAPFRMMDLMRGIQGVHEADFDIEIYDGDKPSAANLMYDAEPRVGALSPPGKLSSVEHLNIGNHQWLVAMTALPAFERHKDRSREKLILGGGTGISLLLALLIWVFLDDRARAIQAAEQATRLALYDALTGLPNRKLISERLVQLLARARRDRESMAVLFIDLDKFKPVNDEFGHAVGDLLLKEVATRLQSCMRESDTVARIGGDEFVALLPEVDDESGAMSVAKKILHALTQPFDIVGNRIEIAACIGVALYPDHGLDQNALVRSADLAMYEAKNSGRSTIRVAHG